MVFKEDGETLVFKYKNESINNLEWFDNEDTDKNAAVTDKKGRAVRLKVEKLELLIFELK